VNFAQAKKAIAAAYGPYGHVEHVPKAEKKVQYRVFIVAPKVKPVCIGAGSSWKKAVAMALASQLPQPAIPSIVLPPDKQSRKAAIVLPPDNQSKPLPKMDGGDSSGERPPGNPG
jgi:hypothetical protein